jgi:NAD(P)H-hydrate repair Nnr-like enzyme with NAD(P)H-hydrate dehydratase domain
VLSGIVGAFLSAGMSALSAASCGAYLHGAAARLAAAHRTGQAPIVAGDVVSAIPAALAGLSASGLPS